MSIVWKILTGAFGILLMLFSVLIAPLPGPLGVPFFIFGLILLLRSSSWMKRTFVKLAKKYPRVVGPVRAMLRPGAKIAALVWLNTLRMERLVLRRASFMSRVRQEVKALLGMRFSRRRWQVQPA